MMLKVKELDKIKNTFSHRVNWKISSIVSFRLVAVTKAAFAEGLLMQET